MYNNLFRVYTFVLMVRDKKESGIWISRMDEASKYVQMEPRYFRL